MRNYVLLIALSMFLLDVYAQEVKYIETENIQFQPNETFYLFGDDVKFRAEPSTESDVIEVLKINSRVTVLSEENSTYDYNGISWKWYKVSYKNKVGYIIGGLLSLDQKAVGDSIYLISFKQNALEGGYDLLIRLVNKKTLEYIELPYNLRDTDIFSIDVYDNKGLSSIKDIFLIDFIAEGCGVDEGGCYFFNDGESLTKAIQFSRMVDGDLYWHYEKVVFPRDNGGIKDKILFVSEHGETLNEDTNYKKVITESIEFTWKGKFLEIKNEESE